MSPVKVSSEFRVMIPEEIRERLNIRPGQKLKVIEKDGIIHMIPLKPMPRLRGFAPGVTTKNLREEENGL